MTNKTITGIHKPQAKTHGGGLILQRCAGCGKSGGECASCRKKRIAQESMMQRAAVNSNDVGEAPEIVHSVLRSSGQPLDASARAYMEPRFGQDFSGVRVHTDNRAAESASAVNAYAYTVGQHVVFGSGQYAPSSRAGQRLLAHELTHVVQQGNGNSTLQGKLSIGAVNDVYEREAETSANTVATHASELGQWNTTHHLSQMPMTAQRLQRMVRPNFVSCNPPSPAIAAITGPDPVGVIDAANARGIQLLDDVIDELQSTRDAIVGGAVIGFPTISDVVATALQSRFGMDPNNRDIWVRQGEGTVAVLIRRFRAIRRTLAEGWLQYTCLAGAAIATPTCAGPACVGATRAVSCEGVSRLFLCAPFWADSADDQAMTLVHESFHIFFGFIRDTGHLANAHCYEQFVADLNNVPIPAAFAASCPP
jgi:hypothetical protein